MKSFSYFITAVLLLMLTATKPASAQGGYCIGCPLVDFFRIDSLQHCVDVGPYGGIGAMMADSKFGVPTRWGYNVGFEVGYTLYFNSNWGLHCGLSGSSINSGISIKEFNASFIGTIPMYNGVETRDYASHFTLEGSRYTDNIKVWYLSIPIAFALQHNNWYGNIGVRFLLPLSSRVNFDYGESTLGVGGLIDGTRSQIEIPIAKNKLEATTGSYKLSEIEVGNIAFPWVVAFAIDGGYTFKLREGDCLRLGIFAEIGLNHTNCQGKEPHLSYDAVDLSEVRLLGSSAVQHLRYASAGIKLQYFIPGKRFARYPYITDDNIDTEE